MERFIVSENRSIWFSTSSSSKESVVSRTITEMIPAMREKRMILRRMIPVRMSCILFRGILPFSVMVILLLWFGSGEMICLKVSPAHSGNLRLPTRDDW